MRSAFSRMPTGGVLVLLDSDDDLPCVPGPKLLARTRQARSDEPLGVVVARSEFESWFLAAAPSLAGSRRAPARRPSTSPGRMSYGCSACWVPSRGTSLRSVGTARP